MKNLSEVNVVSILIACVFFIPLLRGMFAAFSREKIRYTIASLLDNIEFLFGIILSVYLTKKIFFENRSGFYKTIYEFIPEAIRDFLNGRDILIYIIVVPVVLLILMSILRLLTNPIYNVLIGPLADSLYNVLIKMNSVLRSLLGAICQLPKAICMVFVLGVILNFLNYYVPTPIIGKWMNESAAYQLLYKNAVYPVLNSNIAKQIPVIVNDSFAKAVGEPDASDMGQLAKKLTGGNIKVIEYFNGVTLDEAVKSTPEIDKTARSVTAKAKTSREKASLIYDWITKNVKYDYGKAEKVSMGARDISSGAVVAYETGSGICFDYSSLYVAMCRAAGVKVRLVTGLGFSGLSWGDHAWNQAFSEEENKWINVDTTFGTGGNYFDKPDFSVDHKYAEVQGEW